MKIIIAVYALAAFLVYQARNIDVWQKTELDISEAWNDLKVITAHSHPFTSPEHEQVRIYLVDRLTQLKSTAKHVGKSVALNATDKTRTRIRSNSSSEDFEWIVESHNIAFTIHGTDPSLKRVLVSGHYDSGYFTHGAADDGIACAVMLQIIRTLINGPNLAHDIIFLFNSPEEVGLLGSVSFVSNDWANKNIGSFVNMEAAGVSGRELLFRALGDDLISLYTQTAGSPHASVLGNDVFKLGLVSGDTDYRVYAKEMNVSGLDFAFYEGRPFYHTRFDDIDHISNFSVIHMGNNVLKVVRAFAESDQDSIRGSDGAVYFDILGRLAFAYSFETSIAVSISLLVLTLFTVSWNFALVKDFVVLVGSLICTLGIIFGLGKLMDTFNPATLYGYPYVACLLVLSVFVLSFSVISSVAKPDSSTFDSRADTLSLFYLLFGFLNIFASRTGIGLLFFISFWHFCLLLARGLNGSNNITETRTHRLRS